MTTSSKSCKNVLDEKGNTNQLEVLPLPRGGDSEAASSDITSEAPTPGAVLTATFEATPTPTPPCVAGARGIVGMCAALAQGMLKSAAAMLPGIPPGKLPDKPLGIPAIAGNWAGLEPIMVDMYAIMAGSMPAGAWVAELGPG